MQIFTYLIASLSHNITSRKQHENISYSHNTLIIIKNFFEKVNKSNFYKNKKPLKTEDIDINKILVSKKVPYGKESIRYLIGYNGDDVIRPLCIRLPQMIGYVKHFKSNNSKDTITMSFNVTNKNYLKSIIKYGKKSVVY